MIRIACTKNCSRADPPANKPLRSRFAIRNTFSVARHSLSGLLLVVAGSVFATLPVRGSVSAAAIRASASGVPASRLGALSRGVDLGNWFSQAPGGGQYRHDWLRGWITSRDFDALAHAGFTHVRFPVEFEMFLDENHPDVLRPEFLPDFDQALDHILGAGLAVIVDFHARKDTKERLLTDEAFVDKVTAMWGAVARHLANRDPNRVFLETMNEPLPDMPFQRWMAIQEKFLRAIRAAAPDRTIIVTGGRFGSIEGLVRMQPLADRNLVYTFHFYRPSLFVHQGATWINGGRLVTGLAYPENPANRAKVAAEISDPTFHRRVLDYRGNREDLAKQISIAARWAASHGVPLYCGEFGVYAKVAPAASRMRWLRDVREILEANHIGWSMWDYCGGFHLALGKTPGERRLDPQCLKALLGHPADAAP